MAAPVAPYKNMEAAKGMNVPFFYSIAKAGTPPDLATYKQGCYKRGFEVSDSFDSIDITGDCSSGGYKESISGFRESTVSIDFVSRKGDGTETNQKALWKHLKSPGAETDNEPVIWMLYFDPVLDVQVIQCLTATSVSNTYQYDDSLTFSAEFNAKGAPIITDIPSA